jgi:hypothetical protein
MELDNVSRLIEGKPLVTADKSYCLAVVKNIDSFVEDIEASDMASLKPSERADKLIELIKKAYDCEQLDSEAFREKGAARVSVATLGSRRVVIMEMPVIDALLSYEIVSHPGMGVEIMVSKNLPYVREKIETMKNHDMQELYAAVAESNRQEHKPLDFEPGQMEIKKIRRTPLGTPEHGSPEQN